MITEKESVLFMKLKDFFRRNPKTNWGKNKIIEILDNIEDKLRGK